MNKKNELPTVHFCFQLSKSIVFEVSYYRCGNNKNKYFTTSAALFNRPKTDWNQCGQAQKSLLPPFTKAMNFFNKWDKLHLEDLSKTKYSEMIQDIAILKDKYNFIESDTNIIFNDIKTLSKLTPKRFIKTIA